MVSVLSVLQHSPCVQSETGFIQSVAFSHFCVCQPIENRARMRGSRTVESLTLCSRSAKEGQSHRTLAERGSQIVRTQ